MIVFTRPRAILAGLVSTILAAFGRSVCRALPVSLRFSFKDDPDWTFADCESASTTAELLVPTW